MGGERLIDDPLSVLTLLPLAAGLILLVLPQILPSRSASGLMRVSRNISMGVALAIAVLTTMLFVGEIGNIDWTNITQGGYVLENESVSLIPSIGVTWKVGADALSFPMIWLTAVLIPVSMLVEWDAKRGHLFHPLLLLMESALIGVFVALDLFVFFVFWELTLIPMFLLILVWGGEDRRYAAMKFFIYTFTASVFMLVGILVMYFHTDPISGLGSLSGHHFDLVAMTAQDNLIPSEGLRHFVWLLLLIGFATKMPSVPFHTWLPDAHVEAPTPGSVILAAVLLKIGTYGFLRFLLPLFPVATQHPVVVNTMLVLAVIGIIYTACVAAVQSDAKKLVAYTSVAHMGFVTIGTFTLTVQGVEGAIYMMLAHGIISAALFLIVGVVYDRIHSRDISAYGGLVHRMPAYSLIFMLFMLASVGLPGTAGFVGEFLILVGAFKANTWVAALAATGLVLSAAYMLYLYR